VEKEQLRTTKPSTEHTRYGKN